MKNSLILFLTFCCYILQAQETKVIDSLKKEVKLNKNIYKNYSELAWEYINTNIDSTNNYLLRIEKLNLNEIKKGQFYNLKCAYFLLKQDFEKSLLFGNKCEKISLKYNDYKTLGSVYNSISTVYRFKGKYKECEKYLFKSLDYRKKIGDKEEVINSYKNIAAYYATINDNEKAIGYFNIVLGKEKKEINKISTYINIGYLYNQLENPKKSIIYFEKANKILKQVRYEHILTPNLYLNWTSALVKLLKFDDAIEKGLKGLSYNCEPTIKAGIYLNLAESYVNTKKLNLAEKYTLLALKIDKETDYLNGVATDYLLLGKILTLKKDFKKGKDELLNSIKLLKETKDSVNLISGYENYIRNVLYEKNDTSTNTILDGYIDMLNKRTNTNTIKNLNEIETKYRTAEKEAKIKTQELQIQKEKTNKYLAFGLIGLVILLSVIAFYILKNRQKNKEKLLQLELDNLNNSINAMELQNLNQQLDPHEVTNFIQTVSDKVQRIDENLYNQLVNLWDITNIVINHKDITSDIQTEIINLKKYLAYQQEIAYPKFEYAIVNNLSDNTFKIPRLLLRNLTNNSIKHGLKGIDGKINIELFEENNFVNIIVEDDGRGINLKTNKKGIGTSTYENIFTKLNLKNKEKATIQIQNKEKGVIVKVSIPKNYNFNN